MRIVVVHGFGGRNFDHKYAEAMRERTRLVGSPISVETFAWDSRYVDTMSFNSETLLRDWNEAKKNAQGAAAQLAAYIGQISDDVYVVGFSLGCRVILDAVDRIVREGRRVRGLFLLGAAVDYREPIYMAAKHAEFGLFNYYSPKRDTVLNKFYKSVEGYPASGSHGFVDLGQGENFARNYRVACSHRLGNGYTMVAEAIAEMILHFENKTVSGDVERSGEVETLGGHVLWNNIYRRGHLLIQRGPVITDALRCHYRLIDRSAKNKRLAWSRTLSPLLREIESRASGEPLTSD